MTILNKWYLQLVLQSSIHLNTLVFTLLRFGHLETGLHLMMIAASHDHMVTISNIPCQLPISKINGKASKEGCKSAWYSLWLSSASALPHHLLHSLPGLYHTVPSIFSFLCLHHAIYSLAFLCSHHIAPLVILCSWPAPDLPNSPRISFAPPTIFTWDCHCFPLNNPCVLVLWWQLVAVTKQSGHIHYTLQLCSLVVAILVQIAFIIQGPPVFHQKRESMLHRKSIYITWEDIYIYIYIFDLNQSYSYQAVIMD